MVLEPAEWPREDWSRLDALLEEALDLPTSERGAFVDRAAGGDEALRRQLRRLVAADAGAEGFLERPVVRISGAGAESGAGEDSGRRLGSYRLVRVLGRGGMSTVYLAERDDEQFRQTVAVKILREDPRWPEMHERFRAERQALATLVHPNIARLYDGGTIEDGRPYLVMERIEGEPIDRYCDGRRLAVGERIELFRQVCAAVEHAHRNLLVHRDIKPANILVTEDGTPKLLDFGIAKLLAEESPAQQLTRTGLRPMTPSWASPEQVAGGPITTATDTYALGVLLYHLLTGRGPYRTTDSLPHALEREILEGPPVRPSEAVQPRSAEDTRAADAARARQSSPRELARRLRGDLDTIVLKALRKEPERRYGSARELGDDLERHLTSRPVAARPDTLGYRLGKLVRRHTLGVAAGAVLALLLAGFAFALSAQSARIAHERDLAFHAWTQELQTTSYFREMFRNLSPAQKEKGLDLSVGEVFERCLAKIEQAKENPRLQAAYVNILGEIYREMGLFDDAAAMHQEALETRRQVHGGAHPEVAESLHDLAVVFQHQGDLGSAEPLHREALELRRQLLGEEHPEFAESLGDLGLVLYYRGEAAEAEPLLRQSLAIRRRLLGEDHGYVAESLNNLALVVHFRGDLEQAGDLYRLALATQRRSGEALQPEFAIALSNLAFVLHDSGDPEALEMAEESLELRRRLFGAEHPSVAIALFNLGRFRFDWGHPDLAEELLTEALAMKRRLLGPDHHRVGRALTALARLALDRDDLDGAETLLAEARDIFAAQLGRDHWRTLYAETLLAACASRRGRFEEAEPVLLALWPQITEQVGSREPRARDALERIVRHYEDRLMPGEAARYRALRETAQGPTGIVR